MMTTADLTDTQAMRHLMVASQLRPTGVSDERVVAAMATIPRERFLPAALRELAYRDTAIALGRGRYANLPMAIGRLLTEADLLAGDRVLLIGAAGGYTAAVLAGIVAEVTAVEEDADLLALARDALAGTPNVQLVEAPLSAGVPAGAPYDVLVVDGAVEELPADLIAQVAPGGRVVTGLIDRRVVRLASGRRTAGFALHPFVDCDCTPLPGFKRAKPFQF